jgi:NTE family protein
VTRAPSTGGRPARGSSVPADGCAQAARFGRPGSGRGRPITAFVLGGGASLGAIQVGMLRALYECGIVPDLLVGTAVGALNAAFVASRPQVVATSDELARVWVAMQREDVFPLDLPRLVGGLWGWRDHLVGAHSLRRIVARHIGDGDLAEWAIPVHLVAYDLINGREVLLSDGPAVDASLAATAIPGILPPVRVGDRRLVEAGSVNNAPISHAVELGAERIFVLPTRNPSGGAGGVPRNALDATIRARALRADDQLRADVVRYARDAELVVLPAPEDQQVQPTDFGHARPLMAQALAAARAALAPRAPQGRDRTAASHLYAVAPPARS